MFTIPEVVVSVVPDVGVVLGDVVLCDVVLGDVVLCDVVLGDVVLSDVVVVEEGTGIAVDGVGVGRVIANKERHQCIVLFINIVLYM